MILYKYYAPESYNFESIKKGQFWFSTNKLLNDPYDLNCGEAFLSFCPYKNKTIKTIIEERCNYYDVPQKAQIIIDEMRKWASCSFSPNPIDRLMWAHYARSYTGFCVGYKIRDEHKFHKVLYTDQFPERLKNLITARTPQRNKILPIEGEKRHLENYFDDFFKPIRLNDVIKDERNVEDFIKQFLCIKAQEWSYEQEYRLINKTINPNGELQGHQYSVVEVILGTNFNFDICPKCKGIHSENEKQKEFAKHIKQKFQNCKIFHLEMDNHRFFSFTPKEI